MVTLIGWRLRVAIARYRTSVWLLIAAVVLFASLFALGVALSWFIFAVLVRITPVFADTMLLIVFGAIGGFQLLAGVRWGIQRMFLSSDLELLLGSPITYGRVFALKTIDLLISNPVALALLVATAWGYARAHQVPGAIVVAVIAATLLSVATTFPGMWISLVLARWLSGARLRTLLAVIPAIIGLGFAVAAPAIGTFFGRTGSETLDVERLDDVARTASGALHALPTSWAADIVIGVAKHEWLLAGRGIALIAGAGAVAGALAYSTFVRTFLKSWTTLSEASTRIRRSSVLDRLAEPFGGATRALVAKEWKMFTRDLRLLAGAFFPFAFMTYFIISSSQQGGSPPYGLIAFFAFFIPSQASQSLLNEKRNITLLRSTPLRGVDILLGKLLAFLPGVVVLALGAGIGLYAVDRITAVQAVLLVVVGIWLVVWVTWGHLGVAALTAKFDSERGRMALLAALIALAHTLLLSGAHVLLLLWAGARLGDAPYGLLGHPLVGVATLSVVAVSCAGTAALGIAGGRRLERIDSP